MLYTSHSIHSKMSSYIEVLQYENKSLVSTNAKLNTLVQELKTKLNNTHKNYKTTQVQLKCVNKSLHSALASISFDFNQYEQLILSNQSQSKQYEQLILSNQSQQYQINNLQKFNDYLIIKLNTPCHRLQSGCYNMVYLVSVIIGLLLFLFSVLFVYSFCVALSERIVK